MPKVRSYKRFLRENIALEGAEQLLTQIPEKTYSYSQILFSSLSRLDSTSPLFSVHSTV